MTRAGSRGGDVFDLNHARRLHSTHKSEWVALVDEGIRRALLADEFHADELADLDIPPEHQNLVGSRAAWHVNRGYMVEVDRRKGTSKASRGRKSGVFVLTTKGRHHFAGVGAHREGTGNGYAQPRQAVIHGGARDCGSDPGEVRLPRLPHTDDPALRDRCARDLIAEFERQVGLGIGIEWCDCDETRLAA